MSRPALTGMLATIIVHSALFYGFYALRFQFKQEEPKFISLNFVEVSGFPSPSISQKIPETIRAEPSEDLIELPTSKYYTEEAPILPVEKDIGAREEKTIGEPTERDIGEKADIPFKISGEIAKRGILWKKLPKYPKGLQKEVALRFKFLVLPDGSVRSIIPLQKGDPRLEKITITALYKWKFAPLPPSSQEIQEGVITFIYKLE